MVTPLFHFEGPIGVGVSGFLSIPLSTLLLSLPQLRGCGGGCYGGGLWILRSLCCCNNISRGRGGARQYDSKAA